MMLACGRGALSSPEWFVCSLAWMIKLGFSFCIAFTPQVALGIKDDSVRR